MSEEPVRQVVIRRADRPGDLGWMVMAHGEVYGVQFGWNREFEALVARIVADYATSYDREDQAAWIAEVDGERVGCVLLVSAGEPGVAKLRILLVTPEGRGLPVLRIRPRRRGAVPQLRTRSARTELGAPP